MEAANGEGSTAATEVGRSETSTITMEDRPPPCKRTKETAATLVEDLAKLSSAGGSPRSTLGKTTSLPSSPSEATPSSSQRNAHEETIFSTIGMGILPNFRRQKEEATAAATVIKGTGDDATEAALKAVQDAMERGILAFAQQQQQYPRPQLSVRIGVPSKTSSPEEPMHVDQFQVLAQLNSLRNGGGVELHKVETVIGGLWSEQKMSTAPEELRPPMAEDSQGCRGILTVVACLSVVRLRPPKALEGRQQRSLQGVVSPSLSGGTKESQPVTNQSAEISSPPMPLATAVANNSFPARTREFHRSSSMDVLAHVSAEIRDSQQNLAALGAGSYGDNYGNNTNYKKLPPGKTPKNNKRLFVKHKYQDFSNEQPSPDEQALIADRTPNAAFPLKLHETLTEIEKDGHDDIIGWLSHGRSFKIHKQQEFVDQILPKYFVMTKKSSFLRQLNLYGFNRLSGVGPDQGSYYHEKFLRGLKFLCRRMQRNKVNGNRIRAAGNPDEEPILANYPLCPPMKPSSSQHHLATAAVLQLMANQTAHAASTPASHLSTLLGLVPRASTIPRANHLSIAPHVTVPTPTAADVAASILARQSTVERSAASILQGSDKPQLEGSTISGSGGTSDPSSSMPSTETRNAAPLASLTQTTNSTVSFPLKLQRILDKLESEGQDSIMSWLSHGRAFMVHDPDRLVRDLMPLYFNQTKYSSFQRQLHMYNFQRITSGRDKGAYHHPQFLRGQPTLCQSMGRTRVNGKGTRQPGNPDAEPNLYQLPPLPNIPKGSTVDMPSQMPFTSSQPSQSGLSLYTEQHALQPPRSKPKDSSAPSVSSSSAAAESDEEPEV